MAADAVLPNRLGEGEASLLHEVVIELSRAASGPQKLPPELVENQRQMPHHEP